MSQDFEIAVRVSAYGAVFAVMALTRPYRNDRAAKLVQAAEQPYQHQKRDWNPQQPKQ